MKKTLICLLLCLCACATLALAGCGNDGDDDANSIINAARDTVTITLWIVTEDETTVEAIKEVEEEFNSITQTKYTTKVVFNFATEEEYKAALDAKSPRVWRPPLCLRDMTRAFFIAAAAIISRSQGDLSARWQSALSAH